MTISLSIPGDAVHLATLRATVASVAARAQLTLDQMEDVRLAVEEAATALLAGRPPRIEMTLDPSAVPLTVTVSARPERVVELEPDGFSWTILAAMTDGVSVDSDGAGVTITMRFAAVATTA